MRRVLALAAGILALFAVAVVVLLPDLPDPVATHFGPGGQANGFTSHGAMLAVTLGVAAVTLVPVATIAALTHRSAPPGMRWVVGLPAGLAAFVATVMLAILVPQRGLADAADAAVPGAGIAVAVVLAIVVTGAASRLAPAPDVPTTRAAAPAGEPRADLPSGTAVYAADTPTSGVAVVLGLVLLAIGGVLGWLTSWWVGLLVAATAVLVVAGSRFTLVVGPGAVTVTGSTIPWPRITVPLDTITGATTSTIRPLEFGGIGVRLQPGLDVTGVVTRRGPALELTRTDGSRIKVSLERPADAASVVNTLLDRRADAGARP